MKVRIGKLESKESTPPRVHSLHTHTHPPISITFFSCFSFLLSSVTAAVLCSLFCFRINISHFVFLAFIVLAILPPPLVNAVCWGRARNAISGMCLLARHINKFLFFNFLCAFLASGWLATLSLLHGGRLCWMPAASFARVCVCHTMPTVIPSSFRPHVNVGGSLTSDRSSFFASPVLANVCVCFVWIAFVPFVCTSILLFVF